MRRWTQEFAGYRHAVTEGRIERWLDQWDKGDRDLAARTLDAVDFVPTEQIAAGFRTSLASLSGWHHTAKQRQGRWRFAPFSRSPGESGDIMISVFRHANNLKSAAYNDLFVWKSELALQKLGPSDTVVFVDDFAGSGEQAEKTWSVMQELLPAEPRTILILAAALSDARRRIETNTPLQVLAQKELGRSADLFHAGCKHFSEDDKQHILRYCQLADHDEPRGRADSGLMLVFSHTCPNNSLPILHGWRSSWEGLFRRYD